MSIAIGLLILELKYATKTLALTLIYKRVIRVSLYYLILIRNFKVAKVQKI